MHFRRLPPKPQITWLHSKRHSTAPTTATSGPFGGWRRGLWFGFALLSLADLFVVDVEIGQILRGSFVIFTRNGGRFQIIGPFPFVLVPIVPIVSVAV